MLENWRDTKFNFMGHFQWSLPTLKRLTKEKYSEVRKTSARVVFSPHRYL
jgi:hypothetical protein